MLSAVGLYLILFSAASFAMFPDLTAETVFIRGLGSAAFITLTLILCIGPLCRLDPRFLPLLYNRRHLGVTMFLLALAHAVFAVVQFHSQGDLNPLVSLLVTPASPTRANQFPFEILGLLALTIIFLMAATSHDFWLANLTAPVWKALHMLVYVAYGLIVAHVALGALQADASPALAVLVGSGLAMVLGLQLAAAFKEKELDERELAAGPDGYVEICRVEEIAEKRARIACVGGERVAVFRYDGKISCVSNVCQHQNGPLGEGQILDGCITGMATSIIPTPGPRSLPSRNGSRPSTCE